MRSPNIIFILADDLGYGDFGFLNGGLSQTPHLDQLVREGICLMEHYAGSPVCTPARACLLTGRYPHRTGAWDTLEWRGLDRLARDEITLAEELVTRGYRTGLIGKWHLGAFDPAYHPAQRGFEETICFRGGMHDYFDWRVEFGDSVVRSDGRYLTDVWTSEACAFLRRHQNEPFFLHLTYNAPHTPLQVPEEVVIPFREQPGTNEAVARLYGMIRLLDEGVGRVLDTLQETGLAEKTLFVFSSDNGPQFGSTEFGPLDRFNAHWNGSKGSVYEGGIRVPALVRWPAGLPGGRSHSGMVHFCDWFPTLLDFVDGQAPLLDRLDGVSIRPLLEGKPQEHPPRRFWQWNRYLPRVDCNAAVRDGPWKLVRPHIASAMGIVEQDWKDLEDSMYRPERFLSEGIDQSPWPVGEGEPGAPELYNLQEDPQERSNLADVYPERASALLRDLETWFSSIDRLQQATPDR